MTFNSLVRLHLSGFTLQPLLELFRSSTDSTAAHLVVRTVLLVLASSIVVGLVPLLAKAMIDGLDVGQSSAAYSALFLIGMYSITSWLGKSLEALRSFYHSRTDQYVQKKLSSNLFRHVMKLPLRFHTDRKTGGIVQVLTNGLLGYRMVLHHLILSMLPIIVELTTMGVVLIILDHVALLAIVAGSVLLYLFAFCFGAVRIEKPARDVSAAQIDACAIMTDSLMNYETVKYFVAEQQVDGRFRGALERTEREFLKLSRRKLENGLLIAGVFALSLGVPLCLTALKVQDGTMGIGDFVLVNTYVLQISRPFEMIGFAFRDIAQGMAFIRRMTDLLQEESESDHFFCQPLLLKGRADLTFAKISFSYQPDRYVLRNVSFAASHGKVLAIVGASGCGKTSLIRLLLRLVEPTEGQILLDGVPIADMPLSILRSAIAVVPQEVALFNDTVGYNIAFGRPNSTPAEIIEAAKVAHIHEFIAGLPDGYETQVGERGFRLSGGEKQRIAIARAAINQPKIFVFDEATSSLDSNIEQTIWRDLRDLTQATTTLVIAHRLSTVTHADQILVLQDGRIVERGSHSTLLRGLGVYSSMWRAQNGVERVLDGEESLA